MNRTQLWIPDIMSHSSLLQPYDLRDLSLSNRIAMAPMTRARSGENRVANALMAEYYAQRASAGLIISEATTISPQANILWPERAGWYDEAVQAPRHERFMT